MVARKTLRTRLVRWLYRLISPNHPRGWIEIDWTTQEDGALRLFSEGLDRFDLPEIEIADCPADQDLLGYGHGMIYVAIGALHASRRNNHEIRDGDIVDLRDRADAPPVDVRLAARTGTLRLEDVAPSSDRFPRAAAAAYILNAAERMRPAAALKAARLAAGIFADAFDYRPVRPDDASFDTALANSNARAWFLQAEMLAALGRDQDALSALEEAVARAPFMAERIRSELPAGPRGTIDAYIADGDPWEIQAKVRRRKGGKAD